MKKLRSERWSRREFLSGLTLGGTAAFLGVKPEAGVAEPPPETTTIRLVAVATSTCFAPQLMADELLQAEGFSDVRYVKTAADASKVLVSGEADMSMNHGAPEVIREQSEKTPMARKVHASFTKFQALVGPWDHVGAGAYPQFVAV